MEKMDQPPRYESVEWLAETLGINLPAAYKLTKQEGFPAVRITPRRIVIIVNRLDDWMKQQVSTQ